ncbi:MAG: PRC-barrel domain-containing protein [bacterium]
MRDRAGEELGTVEDLLVDDREQKVRFLEIATGGFLGLGETKFMMPVDAITRIEAETVHIDQTRERVAGAPRYAPELVTDQSHWEELYGYYGYAPFWGPDYAYPLLPLHPPSGKGAAQRESPERVTNDEHRKGARSPAKNRPAAGRGDLRTGAGRGRRGSGARQGRR